MHAFDLDLTLQDLQTLNDANSLATFFSALGYDTQSKTAQTAANLGIPEAVQQRIRRVELLSDNERFLQVYLFEMQSVTVADIKAISRAFRDKAGNYLLVFTSDYDFLDFILLDRFGESLSPTAISVAVPALQPRRFTVDRRRPTPVHLRVLRRFTWTETDPFSQFDKLRFAYDLAYWSEVYFNNRGLFSDYYLRERLPAADGEFSEWREDPKPSYLRLRAVYEKATERFAGKKRSELISLLYEPLLKELGFCPKAQSSEEAGLHIRLEDPASGKLLGICLPYPWARELDRKDDAHDTETPDATPTFAVVDLLASQKAPWLILTNGKLWRLYSQQAHSRATNYYEIDLEDVLSRQGFQQDIQDAFRYFWLLFRMQAFLPVDRDWQGKRQPLSTLDRLLLGSEDYAKELGESLKARVFTQVFPVIAEGFIANMRQRGETDFSEEKLAAVFQGTLTLLYRLLFLLYAESRDLLPVHAREYHGASLQHLKEKIKDAAGVISEAANDAAEKAQERESRIHKAFTTCDFDLWARLKKLFSVIDQGSEAMNVPRYNGGLFLAKRDAQDHSPEAQAARFLDREKIADRYLALALDLLARDEDRKTHALVPIDYKSLGVRQLGSIYEGLLEFRLRIAGEKLAVVKEKGREVYKPFKELTEREKTKVEKRGDTLSRGHAYLENDKRERKATGSYYTPDHIVKYIVEHAVGPVLQEKFDALRPKLRQAQKDRRDFVKQQEEFIKLRMKAKPAEQADLIGRELVDELFNIKVLDPAMGSGHFLVEAVDYITDKTLEFLNAFPWNPVLVHLEKSRRTIEEQMEEQNIDIETRRLTDVNLLKRHVLKRCIYGVDLNPMAVELAKVSLWLDCFTLGAPLSFLDHHLRPGNSLIGSTVAEVDAIREAKGQMTLTGTSDWQGLTQAVQAMVDVGGMPDITPEQVAESKEHFHSALADVEVFKKVLDLNTARWFVELDAPKGKGAKSKIDIFDEMLRSGELFEWAHGRTESPLAHTNLARIAHEALRDVGDVAKGKRFFHWELEFPEVFYGKRPGTQNAVERLPDAGFDAVVGNPPYIRIQGMSDEDVSYFGTRYLSAKGKFDIYLPFIEHGLLLTACAGVLGFIIPNKFVTADYGSGIRTLLSEKRALRSIIDFEDRQVFDDISTYVCLLFLGNVPQESVEVRFADPTGVADAHIFLPGSTFGSEPWVLRQSDVLLVPDLPKLADVCEAIFQGLITGGDSLLVGRLDGRFARFGSELIQYEPEIQRHFLRGKDVRRYGIKDAGSLVIYPYHEVKGKDELMSEAHMRKKFPHTFEYLCGHRQELEERGSEAMKYECWYALWCPRQMHRFSSPKILTQVLSGRASFALDGDGDYWFAGGGNAGVYGIVPNSQVSSLYLLAVMNSARFDELLQSLSSRFRGGYFSYARRFIERVPVPVPNVTKQNEIASLVKSRLAASGEEEQKRIEQSIDDEIERLYKGKS